MYSKVISLAGFLVLATMLTYAGDQGSLSVSVECWNRAPVIISPEPLQIEVLPLSSTAGFGTVLIKNSSLQPISAIVLRLKRSDMDGHVLYGTESADFTLYGEPLKPGEQTQIEVQTAASVTHPLSKLEISCEAALLPGGTVIGNAKSPAIVEIRAAHTALTVERKRLLEIYQKGDMRALEAELKKPIE